MKHVLILIFPLHKIGSLQALSTPQVPLCQTTYPMKRIYDLTFKERNGILHLCKKAILSQIAYLPSGFRLAKDKIMQKQAKRAKMRQHVGFLGTSLINSCNI